MFAPSGGLEGTELRAPRRPSAERRAQSRAANPRRAASPVLWRPLSARLGSRCEAVEAQKVLLCPVQSESSASEDLK